MKKFTKKFFLREILFSILYFLLLQNNPIYGCSCRESTLEELFESADAVFIGEVLEIKLLKFLGLFGDYGIEATIKVSKNFKGNTKEQVIVSTGLGGGDCGYKFNKNVRYLIYAHGSGEQLSANTCSGTIPLENALKENVLDRISGFAKKNY